MNKIQSLGMRLFISAFFITLVGIINETWALPSASESSQSSPYSDFSESEKSDLLQTGTDHVPWRAVIGWSAGNLLKKENIENDFILGAEYVLPGLTSSPWSFEVTLNPTLKWGLVKVERFQYWQQYRGQDLFWGIYVLQSIETSNQLAFVTELNRLKVGARIRMDQMFMGYSLGLSGYELHIGMEIPIKF